MIAAHPQANNLHRPRPSLKTIIILSIQYELQNGLTELGRDRSFVPMDPIQCGGIPFPSRPDAGLGIQMGDSTGGLASDREMAEDTVRLLRFGPGSEQGRAWYQEFRHWILPTQP